MAANDAGRRSTERGGVFIHLPAQEESHTRRPVINIRKNDDDLTPRDAHEFVKRKPDIVGVFEQIEGYDRVKLAVGEWQPVLDVGDLVDARPGHDVDPGIFDLRTHVLSQNGIAASDIEQ